MKGEVPLLGSVVLFCNVLVVRITCESVFFCELTMLAYLDLAALCFYLGKIIFYSHDILVFSVESSVRGLTLSLLMASG